VATKSPPRPTTESREAASGRDPTQPPAPARAPWARGFGVQGSGRLDLNPVSGAVICFRTGFRGVVASDCVRCARGEGDLAREALWFDPTAKSSDAFTSSDAVEFQHTAS
jgi:hypothetical protein